MSGWETALIAGLAILAATAAYVLLRWRRGPKVRSAMLIVGGASFLAGALLGSAIFHEATGNRGGGLALAPAMGIPPNAIAAQVTSIVDGDTFYVLGPGNVPLEIRPRGIDAPESRQPFGPQSTENLARLIVGKRVKLQCDGVDQYGRQLCRVFLPSGEDVCLDQIKAGMAWHYKQFQDEQTPAESKAYADAECIAMKAKIGLWSDGHPVQPQDFRHGTDSPLLFNSSGCRVSSQPEFGPVVGNQNSHKYFWPGCPDYDYIANSGGTSFQSPQAAAAAGYEPARNCP